MTEKSRRMWKIVALSLIMLSGSGCSPLSDESTTIKPSSLSSFSADTNAEVGSRNNPIALGDVAIVNDWQVQITSVNKNALKLVMDSDDYASPPASNQRFVLFNISATYIGEESGDPRSELQFKIVGNRGNTFSKSCSYSVNTFEENEETFTGATVTGDLCFSVDANQISGATISIQADYSSQERKFVLID